MARPMWPEGETAWDEGAGECPFAARRRYVSPAGHRRAGPRFTEDCVFRFAEQPEQRGRDALRQFFAARFSRQQNYRLTKTLMAIEGNRLANVWDGTWVDSRTGKPMAGRGLEVWRMRGGMIAVWDAAFNVWEHGGERRSAIT